MKGFQEKKQLTLHEMCFTSLLCGPWVDFRPFYGLYGMGFLSHKKGHKSAHRPHRRDVTHILCKVSCLQMKLLLVLRTLFS